MADLTIMETLQASRDAGREPLAAQGLALFRSWVADDLPRVPGMDTSLRLLFRAYYHPNVETIAAKEYLYRWNLALQSRVFGAPHLLGM